MENIRTTREPRQAIPTFIQTIELLMRPENAHAQFNVSLLIPFSFHSFGVFLPGDSPCGSCAIRFQFESPADTVSLERLAARSLNCLPCHDTCSPFIHPCSQVVPSFQVDVKVQNDPERLFRLMRKTIEGYADWEKTLAPRILLGLW